MSSTPPVRSANQERRKPTVAVTLSRDLIDLIDRDVARKQSSRSQVVREALRFFFAVNSHIGASPETIVRASSPERELEAVAS